MKNTKETLKTKNGPRLNYFAKMDINWNHWQNLNGFCGLDDTNSINANFMILMVAF